MMSLLLADEVCVCEMWERHLFSYEAIQGYSRVSAPCTYDLLYIYVSTILVNRQLYTIALQLCTMVPLYTMVEEKVNNRTRLKQLIYLPNK